MPAGAAVSRHEGLDDSLSEPDRICLRLLCRRHLHKPRVSRELNMISLIVGAPAVPARTSSSV